jgi:adenine-specific DNA glycosylase
MSEAGPEYLLVQRPETGLLAGLWDFPNIVLEDPRMDEPATEKVLMEYLESLGLVGLGKLANKGSSLHIFTHIRRTSQVYTVKASGSGLPELKGKWASEEDIREIAVSELGRKVLRLALEAPDKKRKAVGDEKVRIKGPKVVKLEKGQSKLSFALTRKTKIET